MKNYFGTLFNDILKTVQKKLLTLDSANDHVSPNLLSSKHLNYLIRDVKFSFSRWIKDIRITYSIYSSLFLFFFFLQFIHFSLSIRVNFVRHELNCCKRFTSVNTDWVAQFLLFFLKAHSWWCANVSHPGDTLSGLLRGLQLIVTVTVMFLNTLRGIVCLCRALF